MCNKIIASLKLTCGGFNIRDICEEERSLLMGQMIITKTLKFVSFSDAKMLTRRIKLTIYTTLDQNAKSLRRSYQGDSNVINKPTKQ